MPLPQDEREAGVLEVGSGHEQAAAMSHETRLFGFGTDHHSRGVDEGPQRDFEAVRVAATQAGGLVDT